MLILKAVKPTVLKRDPLKQASALPPDAKYALPLNATLELSASAPAANQHLQVTLKQPLHGFATWFAFAEHVQVINQAALEAAKDRAAVFNRFLITATQPGFDQNKLAFLDRGVTGSAFANQVAVYPDRLRQLPDQRTIVSMGKTVQLSSTQQTVTFSLYPQTGIMPPIDQTGLGFLHADIQEACVCVGSVVNGQMNAHWLGRNALTLGQFWSATKLVPMLNVVSQANAKSATTRIQDCLIRAAQSPTDAWEFIEAAIDIVSYRKDDVVHDLMISNQLSDTLKRFSSLASLEQWFANLTGNKSLKFRGYYSEAPLIEEPVLQAGTTIILRAQPAGSGGENLISAYDLTRLISMLGWHLHLSPGSRLPAAQWHSLEAVVKSLGYDSARYVDVALQALGLIDSIRAPVILSKLGFGSSDRRRRTELCYTALVQFIDDRPQSKGLPAKLRTIALTLRAAAQKLKPTGERDLDEEARWLDARMAAEVTEILRRVVTEELA